MIDKLPVGTIDGWVSGHVHESVHTFLKEFPIIQNPNGGKYANVIKLKFKLNKDNKYEVMTKDSEIHGPIPLCSHIFEEN